MRVVAGFSHFQKQLSSPQAPCLMPGLTRTHLRTSWLLHLLPDGNPSCGNALIHDTPTKYPLDSFPWGDPGGPLGRGSRSGSKAVSQFWSSGAWPKHVP